MFSHIILYLRDKIFEISENHGDEIVLPGSLLRMAGESHH